MVEPHSDRTYILNSDYNYGWYFNPNKTYSFHIYELTPPTPSGRRIISVIEDSDSESYVYLRCPANQIDVSKIPEGFEWGYSEDEKTVHISIHSGQSLDLGEADLWNAFTLYAYLNNSYGNQVYATGEIDKPSVSYQKTFNNEQLEVKLESWDVHDGKWFEFKDKNVAVISKDTDKQNTYDMTFKITPPPPTNQ